MELTVNQKEIETRIFTVRGMQVMLDSHLAELYDVETKQINRVVKRNQDRFPEKFMFQLTEIEWDSLRYQIDTLKDDATLRYQIGTSKSDESNNEKLIVLAKSKFLTTLIKIRAMMKSQKSVVLPMCSLL